MAGILESLAMGLRQAGGVLNPAVQGILSNEASQDEAFRQRVAMQRLEEQIARQREQALAGAVGPALQGGDLDAAARAAIGSGAPGGVNMGVTLLGKAEERKARAENLMATLQAKQMDLRQKHQDKLEELRQRGADAQAMQTERLNFQRSMAEFQAQARRDMVGLAASLRTPPAPSLATIADPNDPTKSIVVDARTMAKIGDAPPKAPAEKALPSPLQKQLTDAATNLDSAERFTKGFQDDYAGYKIGKIGDAANWAKRTFGDNSGQAQWWQDYELHQSQIRNQLFGSALTKTEVEAWNKSAINPGMDPSQVRQNLARRERLERTGFERLSKGAVAGGYKKEQVEALTGRPVSGASGPQPANAGGAQRIRLDANGDPIQ